MRTKTLFFLLPALLVCGCGKKGDIGNLQPVKVKTEAVTAGGMQVGQTYPGTIEEMNGVSLSFPVGGTLKQLLVDEGQTVSKGQLIAVTDGKDASNALEMSRSAVKTAEAAYDQALDSYKRMKMIHDKQALPDIKWVEAQSKLQQARSALEGARAQARIAGKGLGDTRLYAPFSGYISTKNMEVGQTVAPGQTVVNLVKIDRVKVKISVPESDVSHIAAGSAVRVSVEALGDSIFTGRITEKNVNADPLSHTYDVKAVVSNAGHKLLPGMIADVSVAEAQSGASNGLSTITLPAGVIQLNFDNRTFVWTVVGGKARQTFVTTGDNIGDKVVITNGLKVGDKVIVDGEQKVSDGMYVTD